jgi:hypothetical protein
MRVAIADLVPKLHHFCTHVRLICPGCTAGREEAPLPQTKELFVPIYLLEERKKGSWTPTYPFLDVALDYIAA